MVADLTYQQRKYEANLKTESQSKNLKRSEEETRDKQVWKVIGKGGGRRLHPVVLREGEMVDRTGNVVEILEGDQAESRRKRRYSGGNSPQHSREKRGRVRAGDFGVEVRE